jgi:hypothetical protein
MDDAETVKKDTEQLDQLEEEIQKARRDLDDETHKKDETGPMFFEDDQEEPEGGPGHDSVPA